MKICAVVLDYRGAQKTGACLRSLIGQGLDGVIVVDNSADAAAGRALTKELDDVKQAGTDYVLHLETPASNLGFAGGVNLALLSQAAQQYDTFLLLNNDATLDAGALRLMTAELAAGADLVAPTIVDDAGSAQGICHYQRFLGILSPRELPGSYPYLSGCCLLFKRDLFSTHKLLDEDFFMYGEDTMLSWKLQREQKTLACLATAVVRHGTQARQKSSSLFYEYHMARAHLLLALKARRSVFEVPLLLVAKCAGLLLRALLRCIRYRSATPLLAGVLACFPIAIRKT